MAPSASIRRAAEQPVGGWQRAFPRWAAKRDGGRHAAGDWDWGWGWDWGRRSLGLAPGRAPRGGPRDKTAPTRRVRAICMATLILSAPRDPASILRALRWHSARKFSPKNLGVQSGVLRDQGCEAFHVAAPLDLGPRPAEQTRADTVFLALGPGTRAKRGSPGSGPP